MNDSEDHPDDLLPTEAAPPPREKPMGFWGHIEELRGTIIKSVVVFTLFAVLIGFYLTEFNRLLMWPFYKAVKEYPGLTIDLGTTTIMEGFNMIIQMCLLGGLACSAPFILYFIGRFVAPALSEKELKAVLPMCASAFLLFLMGAAFAFFLLVPSTVRMAIEINKSFDLAFRWNVGSYYSILSWLVLGVGGSFEFPLVIVLLVWLGLVTTEFLRKYRRHALVLCFIIAAIITPTPDPFVQTSFAVPLYVLYEIAILASSRVEKRKRRDRV
ncbi:MAG: twin-arginine translocase subunit TatC [Opitutus sp.]|nr:twin-arginine translocase subunit TatC [Opitutus sp.]